MILPNSYSTTKLNKYCDVDNTNQSELADLLQDFFSVNLFKIGYDIKNPMLQLIENKDSIIFINISDFQNNKKILCLIQYLSELDIEIALRLAMEETFNCNLSGRKINLVREYHVSLNHME
jgi:hypothetical protein